MNVNLSWDRLCVTPSLQEHIFFRIRSDFFTLKGKGLKISVFLRDLGRKDDGREKMCQIFVTIPNQPQIVIADVQENMYAAVDTAIKKAAHRARRILACKRSRILGTFLTDAKDEASD